MYFLVAVFKSVFEITIARCTVKFAPTHAILYIWTWMRALQIDPKHGRLQRQAQVLIRLHCLCVRTDVLIILMPFCMECECKEGDVVFAMKNQTLEAVVTATSFSFKEV